MRFPLAFASLLGLLAPTLSHASGPDSSRLGTQSPSRQELLAPVGPPSSPPRASWRFDFDILLGGTRWLWGEEVVGQSDLEENGIDPMVLLRAELVREDRFSIGAGMESMRGAIEYRGYLQNSDSPQAVDGLLPFTTHTHYLFYDPWLALQWRLPLGDARALVGGRVSFPWWRRTIDSRTDSKPGEKGYIEEWSQTLLTPELGIELGSHRSIKGTFVAGLAIPFQSQEMISGGISLQPKAKNGRRLDATLEFQKGILDGVLVELEWFTMDFGKSDPKIIFTGFDTWTVHQPNSSLDRLSLRAGIRL